DARSEMPPAWGRRTGRRSRCRLPASVSPVRRSCPAMLHRNYAHLEARAQALREALGRVREGSGFTDTPHRRQPLAGPGHATLAGGRKSPCRGQTPGRGAEGREELTLAGQGQACRVNSLPSPPALTDAARSGTLLADVFLRRRLAGLVTGVWGLLP